MENVNIELCEGQILVLKVEPEKKPELIAMDNNLEAMQAIVGGYIEMIMPFSDEVALVCNEDGKLEGLPLNRALCDEEDGSIQDIIAGTFFIALAPSDSDDFASLSPELAQKYYDLFLHPEIFLRTPSGIVRLKAPF